MNKIEDILNKNDLWDLYHGFFFMNDITRLRKFMAKAELFKLILNIPGDIVELGVFKGVGIAQLLKLREIFIPASNKKVIGFDLFSESNIELLGHDIELKEVYNESEVNMKDGINKNNIEKIIDNIKFSNNTQYSKLYKLIEGNVKNTIPEYLKENPGFRISFLYLDMDIDEPTFIALNLLYERVVKGGIIIFDEYACQEWTESNAVDRFLALHPNLSLKSIQWSTTPTAYTIKE